MTTTTILTKQREQQQNTMIHDHNNTEQYALDINKSIMSSLPLNLDTCSICFDNNAIDSNNPLVYCDGCNICVHTECYGGM